MPSLPRPRTRAARLMIATFGFGVLLAVVPLPSVVFATQSVGASEAIPTSRPMTASDRVVAQAAADEPLGSDRVVSSSTDVGEFTAIGFTFDREPTEPVLVRVRNADGSFEPWHELESEDSEGPDPASAEAGRAGTAPYWVDHADGYEVSLAAADAESADVVTVHDELHRSIARAEPAAGAATVRPFDIALRGSWGARAAVSTSYGTTVKMAVVHHSDSSNAYSPADVPGILRSIQAYHMDGRGWSDIAYNFVVDKYGGIWEGRGGGIDQPVIGAHAQGFNTNTVGVMVIGDYTAATPTSSALESVSRVIGWKLSMYGNIPGDRVDFTSGGSPKYAAGLTVNLPRVVGHTDVGSTSCPGSIEAQLGWIRVRSQQWFDYVGVASGTSPTGVLEDVSIRSGNIVHVGGWALDRDTSGPVQVLITLDGIWYVVLAEWNRPDVAASYPGYDARKGFLWEAVANKGSHQVCATAINVGAGGNTSLGCRSVTVK